MGREEKRERERTLKQLERRLHRKPTEEEVEKALAEDWPRTGPVGSRQGIGQHNTQCAHGRIWIRILCQGSFRRTAKFGDGLANATFNEACSP